MRFAFRHKIDINSKFVILRRIGLLSGVKPVLYDCCPNSCIVYTEKYIHHQYCPFCQESRLKPDGKPHRQFLYLPLIPRLQGFFSSADMIKKMSYRSSYRRTPGQIADVFDGDHYNQLLRHRVIVDGEKLNHRYFSDPRDIALSLSTDSYLLQKRRRRGPSATPILLQSYNLPPQIRTQLRNLICIGIIPGPHQPKDLGSFLCPLDNEMANLAYGVATFDVVEKSMFQMHAYIMFKLGDIIAVEKFMQIKGHNAIYPCRSCKIRATRGTGNTYYVPLQPPKSTTGLNRTLTQWQANRLPLRSHQEFIDTVGQLDGATTKSERARIAKETGIKNLPALRRVGSLDYARSMPWEWFHLLLENVIPNLVDLWTGQFKGLDAGDGGFEISRHIWEEVGKETAAAVRDIPASFVRVLSNIATDRSLFTAESWCFWFVYLAPILLKDRFMKKKYYKHMCELAEIMKIMLRFRCTIEQVKDVEERLISWVEKYERYVLRWIVSG